MTIADSDCFVHPAFFYHSEQEYRDCLVPFITTGLDAGQPVLAAVPEDRLSILRDGLGARRAEVTLLNMTDAGRNPGRILGGVLSRFADEHEGQPVRIIGEPIWAERSEVEYPACVQHEALINDAFAGRELTIVCAYDATRLSPDVLDDARQTHPVLWQVGRETISPAYAPTAAWSRHNQPLGSPATASAFLVRELSDLARARDFAAAYGRWFDLSDEQIANLQLIVSELATSTLKHSARPCRLVFWQHDGHLICEVRDISHLDDPMVGRRSYDRETPRGCGLFVVNALADLVRAHTTPQETTIHAYIRLEGAA